MNRPSLLLCLLALSASGAAAQPIPAFPGAEGFGAIASGGRGGDVYYVTNLNASGAGSFAEGVHTAPAQGRTIMFAVSGHIRLPSGSGTGMTFDKSNITVAGQTAPGDGICFWNNNMNITANNLIFRNIRWRRGYSTAGSDSVDIAGSSPIIFDHCDLMFSTDENMSSFGVAPDNMTFQWSTNAWGLQGHSCGGLWKMNHATVHHTLWANNHTRNPKLIGCDVFDWVNNVTFGWDNGFNMAPEVTGGLGYNYKVNIRGSFFIHGGSTGDAIYGGGANDDGTNKFQLHMSDAALDGGDASKLNITKTNYGLVSATLYDKVATPWTQTSNGTAVTTQNPVVGVQVAVDPMMTAYKKVLSQVGAVRMDVSDDRPLRDEITQLCVDGVAGMQRRMIANPTELGLSTGTEQADLKSTPAPTDSDRDGLPDYWEDALGFDKTTANNNVVFTAPQLAASFFPPGSPVGYTQLEEYLHFLAVPHGTLSKNTADASSYVDIDLRKFTSGFTSSPVFTVTNITGGSVSASGPGNAIVRFTPALDAFGRAGFTFMVTDADGSTWTQQLCLLVTLTPLPRDLTWKGDGTGNVWDAAVANWKKLDGTATSFRAGDAATFDESGSNSPSIKLSGALLPASVSVEGNTKNYTFDGNGTIGGAATLSKTGNSTLTIKTNNTYNGTTSIDGGSVVLGAAGAANAGTLGTGQISLQDGATITNAWSSTSTTQNIAGALFIPEGHSATINTGRRVYLSGAVTGGGDLNINHQGTDGVIDFKGAMNTFSGNLNLSFTGTNGTSRAIFNGGTFNGWSAATVNLGAGLTINCTTNSTGNTFGIGALTGSGRLGGGTSGSPNYTVGGLNKDTTFDGVFIGNAMLTKVGIGTLTLTGNSSHTGATTVSAGVLECRGVFGNSTVTVAAGAALTGNSTFGGGLIAAMGGTLSPGVNGGATVGTLTAASLNMTAASLRFDLSSSPAGTNDLIQITSGGGVVLAGPIDVTLNLTSGTLGNGTYHLVSTTGPVSAGNASFSTNLPPNPRQTMVIGPTASGLSLTVSGTAGSLVWTGANGGIWDQRTTAAWSGAAPATFYNFDTVTFNDSAAAGTGNVTIATPVLPRSITVNNTISRPYTFSGAPITGETALVKSGNGTLTLNLPSHTLSSTTTTASGAVTVPSTAGLFQGMAVSGPGIPAGTTIAAIGNATTLTLSQNATTSNATASLIFETHNTFTGGTVLNAGTIALTSNVLPATTSGIFAPPNAYGLGTGPITLNGGTLVMYGTAGADYLYGALPNDLVVPASANATIQVTMHGSDANPPYRALSGNLTGNGTLNLVMAWIRGGITGDWSSFSGQINVRRAATGGTDNRFVVGSDFGFPAARVKLENVRMQYSPTPAAAGTEIPIGSLSGNATASIEGAYSGTNVLTWRVGGLGLNDTYSGTFKEQQTTINRTSLVKEGAGTWTLNGTGNATLAGSLSVQEGTLAISRWLAFGQTVSVAQGGTIQLAGTLGAVSLDIAAGGAFGGHGAVNASSVTCAGSLAVSGGNLSFSGDTLLGGTVSFASISSDRLAVAGSLELGGQISLPQASGFAAGRNVLVTYTGDLLLDTTTLNIPSLPATLMATLDTSTPGQVAVKLTSVAAYQTWQTTNFGNTTNPSGLPSADPDNDGMTNLEEYEVGTNPNSAASSFALVWVGGGSNYWDIAASGNWLENGNTPRVFRSNRQVSFTDAGSNSPAVNLTQTLRPASVLVNNSTAKAYTFSGSGGLSGPMALTKSGNGTLTIATSNGYTGNTTVTGGVLTIQDGSALGSSANGTFVPLNSRIELDGDISVEAEPLTIAGTGGSGFSYGALLSKTGINTWGGPVTLSGNDTRIGTLSGATLIVAGSINSALGTAGLIFRPYDMASPVILSGANTFSGNTTIIGGVLQLAGGQNRLPVTTVIKFGGSAVSGVLDLNGTSQEVAGISVASGTANVITNSAAAIPVLTINQTATSTFTGTITGNLSLTKAGTGNLTLSGNTSWSGATVVNAGRLILGNGLLTSPSLTIKSGASLQSMASLAGNIFLEAGGALLTVPALTGNLTVQAGGNFTLTGVSIAGNVTNFGTITLTGSAAFPVSGTFINNGTLDLSGWTGTVPPGLVNNGAILLPGGGTQYPPPQLSISSPAADPATVTNTALRLRLIAAATSSVPSAVPSMSWMKVSGPGTVTFDNPAAASTGAQFSAPGTYVVQSTASLGSGAGVTTAIATRTVIVAPPTLTFRQGESGYSHSGTFIRSDNPTWNSGNRTELLIGRTTTGVLRALFGFDLTGLPAGFVVQSAKLDLWTAGANAGSPGDLQLRAITANFTEGTSAGASATGNETGANWTRRSDLAGNLTWTAPGGDFGPTVLSTVSSFNATIAGVQKTFPTSPDFRSLVQAAISGARPLNLVVLSPATEAGTGNNYVRFQSDDSTTTAQRPMLTLGFSVNEAPSISVGTAPAATNGIAAALSGNVTSSTNSIWSLVSGPGNATFTDAANPATTVTFSAAGSYVLRLIATNASGETSADLNITVARNAGIFSDWQDINWPGVADQVIIGETADPDRDGIPNLLEFATTSDPKTSSFAPGVLLPNGSRLEFTYSRLKTAAVAYVVEYSDTLAAGSWITTGVTDEILSDNGMVQSVKSLVPLGSGTKRFVRLRVVK